MGPRWLLVCLLALPVHAEVGVCRLYKDVYQSEIKAKIQAGIPFELMSAMFDKEHVLTKRAVRVSYNLWDEVVTLRSGEDVLARFTIQDGLNQLCRYLEIDDDLKPNQHYVYRLLLNPLWGERMTRLQVATREGSEGAGRVVGIHWNKLASEMPSDKILVEKELSK